MKSSRQVVRLLSPAIVVVLLFAALAARAQSGGGYDQSPNVIAGGGATFGPADGYRLGGTIGQADAGRLSAAGVVVTGGFWGGVAGLAAPTPTPRGGVCVGDCDGSGDVTINEIITCVNIALGTAAVSTCSACDSNHDGQVEINEIIQAVNAR